MNTDLSEFGLCKDCGQDVLACRCYDSPVNPPARPYDPLDDIGRNKHGGNIQSLDALADNEPRRDDQRKQVWEYICAAPSTCEEVSIALGMRYTTVSACLSWLKAKSYAFAVKIQGRPLRRPTTSGSMAAVIAGMGLWLEN